MEKLYTLQNLFLIYSDIVRTDATLYANRKRKLVLPKLSQVFLTQICNQAATIFMEDKMVMEINEDVIIVGDLHGHILDLIRILNTFGMPPTSSYLFLGDIVDRGEFSLETVTLILVMKILFPKNVFVVRGNHEFSEMCEQCGFYAELSKVYGNTIIQVAFNHCFSNIPFAAIVQNKYLCVHGGIGPSLESIDQIREIMRPIYDFNFEPILSLLWSDPNAGVGQFKASSRGLGYVFGAAPLQKFLKKNQITCLIRGHECVQEGMDSQLKGKCITVFSASNYCGLQPNKAAVLTVTNGSVPNPTYFSSLKYLLRSHASIVSTDCKTTVLKAEIKNSLPKLKTTATTKVAATKEAKESGETGRSVFVHSRHMIPSPLRAITPRTKSFSRGSVQKRMSPFNNKLSTF